MSDNIFSGEQLAVLRESAITAHADFYSNYIDTQGWQDVRIEVEVAADSNLDGSNYWEFFVKGYTGASPGTGSGYATLAAGDVTLTSVAHATNIPNTTRDTGTNAVKIDATTKDSVTLRYHIHRAAGCTYRYLCVMGDVTTAGSYPTGVVGVRAYLSAGRSKPEGELTPVTGAVS